MVVQRDEAIAVLAGGGFGVTPHIEFTAALADRLKIDLSATLAVMRLLPLWIDGPQHVELRRKVATFLAEDRSTKLARAANRIRPLVIDTLGTDGSEHVDLLRMVCEVVDLFMEELTGLPRGRRATRLAGQASSVPISGLQRANDSKSMLKHQFAQANDLFPDEPTERHAVRVGQWAMGRDPLIGTLCLSLHHHIDGLGGARLDSRRLPSVPTHTGVPAIGRIARVAQTVAGCPVSAGALVECRLDSLTGRPASERRHFFGAGRHLCLGRTQALALWDCVAGLLAELDTRLTTTEFALAQNDVFDIPSVFTARRLASRHPARSPE